MILHFEHQETIIIANICVHIILLFFSTCKPYYHALYLEKACGPYTKEASISSMFLQKREVQLAALWLVVFWK